MWCFFLQRNNKNLFHHLEHNSRQLVDGPFVKRPSLSIYCRMELSFFLVMFKCILCLVFLFLTSFTKLRLWLWLISFTQSFMSKPLSMSMVRSSLKVGPWRPYPVQRPGAPLEINVSLRMKPLQRSFGGASKWPSQFLWICYKDFSFLLLTLFFYLPVLLLGDLLTLRWTSIPLWWTGSEQWTIWILWTRYM